MTAIEFRGKRYHCPHADLIPRHTAEERDRLDDNGAFAYPVLLYRDADLDLDDCVLDGHGRLGSASRTGADVEFKHLGEMTTEAAKALAEHIEDDRRHETADAIRQRRQKRIRRVTELRAEGKSLRAIAEEVGVSHEQVRLDIEESGVNPLTGENENAGVKGLTPEDESPPVKGLTPETVTGRDGKTYPATRPEPELEEPDESGVNPLIPEPDDTLPEPSIDAGRKNGQAPWMTKGGKPVDPNHPFADELKKFTALTASLTAKIRALPEDHPLRQAMVEVGTAVLNPPVNLLHFTGDVIHGCEVKRGTVTFVGLRMLRALVRKYGKAQKYVKGWALAEVSRVIGEQDTVTEDDE